MSKELQAQYTSNKTVYAVLLNATGSVWNGTTFESPLTANWANYKLAATEQSTTGLYEANMPAVSSGVYNVLFYLQAGGSPATTDLVISAGSIQWSGTAEVPLYQAPVNAVEWGGSAVGGMPYSGTPPTTAQIATAILTDTTSSDLATAGSLGHLVTTAPSWYTTPPTTAAIATAILTDTTGGDLAVVGSLGHLVTTAPSWYTAPDNMDIATIVASVGSTLATTLAAVKAQTDKLVFDGSNFVKADVQTYATGQDPATLVWAAGTRTLTSFGFSVTVSGNVTVGGYASGQDPATLLLATPSQKIQTTANGTVIDTTQTFTTRNQDAVSAPTIADAMQGAWTEAFGKESTSGTAYTKQLPASTNPARTFTLGLDGDGDPISRS